MPHLAAVDSFHSLLSYRVSLAVNVREIPSEFSPRYLPHYTVADHASWAGDWELLDGVAVAMTTSPFGRHAERLSLLAATLWNAIDAAGCPATVLAEIDWIVTNDTVVQPDLIVVCGSAPPRHMEQAPALIVEILSAATRDRILYVKRALYESQGVGWYLIVDPDENQTTLLRLSQAGGYEPVPTAGRCELRLCPECLLLLELGA